MYRDMSVGDFVSQLKREIADRQAMVDKLEAILGAELPPERRKGAGLAALDILREAGRPMHGLDEILPALVARGYEVKRREGFATMLLRIKGIRRTAPGTFACEPDRAGAE